MNCIAIEVLIHCHVFPAPHPRGTTPTAMKAINYLLGSDLIKEDGSTEDGRYITTERGDVHIRHLKDLPFPVAVWNNQNGDEI